VHYKGPLKSVLSVFMDPTVLTYLVIHVCVCVFSVCNVAVNLPSYQSSVYKGNEAHRCNDGKISDDRLCHSLKDKNPWWAVDLGVPLSVRKVFFTNRVDAGMQTTHCKI